MAEAPDLSPRIAQVLFSPKEDEPLLSSPTLPHSCALSLSLLNCTDAIYSFLEAYSIFLAAHSLYIFLLSLMVDSRILIIYVHTHVQHYFLESILFLC